jgi:hypothetical protein
MSPYPMAALNGNWSQMVQMNPYVRQMQQQQIQQQWQQQQFQQQLLRNALPTQTAQPIKTSPMTNHSISSMIDSDKTINKPKKLGFSISAIVGEESEPEEISEEMPIIEEVVDVVSEDQHSDQETIETSNAGASSPCHSAGNDSHDSGNASSLTSATTPPLIDDDLRRALTIDPRTLSPEEKSRLRQKLAEIALRNISQDSGVCSEVC